jgi:hypothetical protein
MVEFKARVYAGVILGGDSRRVKKNRLTEESAGTGVPDSIMGMKDWPGVVV